MRQSEVKIWRKSDKENGRNMELMEETDERSNGVREQMDDVAGFYAMSQRTYSRGEHEKDPNFGAST